MSTFTCTAGGRSVKRMMWGWGSAADRLRSPDRPGGALLRACDCETNRFCRPFFARSTGRPAGRHQKGSPVVSGAHCGSHGGQLLRHERLVLKCHADRDRPAIKYDDAVLYCTYYSVLPCKRAVLKAVLNVYTCIHGHGLWGHGAGACMRAATASQKRLRPCYFYRIAGSERFLAELLL